MNGYKREEVLVKIKPDQMVGATAELESDTRRSGRIKIANRQFKDYELYTTMEEEEQLMLAKQWKKIQQMMKRMRKFKPLWRILSWFSTKKKKESSTTAARARARTTGILLTSGVPPPPEDKHATIRKTCADRKKKGGKSPPKGGPKTGRNRPRIRSVSLLLCTPLQNLPPKMPVGMSWNLILALTAISAITLC
jgi:hypothetical protein